MKWFRSLFARFCGFSLVGLVSTLLAIGIMAGMSEGAGVNGYVSYATAYVATILFSYFANTILIYRAPVRIADCLGFFATYASGMLVGTGLLAVAKRAFPCASDALLGCGVLPFTVMWNFAFVNCILTRRPSRCDLARDTETWEDDGSHACKCI